ncbi:NAD/NADP octopine/nopaline dehydrogenase family protein [Salinarimonas sp. NSM]|uniref:NAD/NADP octopine/nopaline dehydrogenase family protein n=1 Tax=Salinarimonas sp. NSM TaxID=3458003 RepID=UPI004035CD77
MAVSDGEVSVLRVVVCGEGPIAHSVAFAAALAGHGVRMLVPAPGAWSDRLRGILPDGRAVDLPLRGAFQRAQDCIPGCDMVLVCVPHAEIPAALAAIAPHLDARTLVGGVPGFGGFGIVARRLLPVESCVFGVQRIPFVVRAHEAGRLVSLSGVRRQSYVAAMPAERSAPVAELVARLLQVRTVPVSHYVNIELSPSNSVVNPARLYALFETGRRPTGSLEFFTDWDEDATRVLLRLDAELQAGRRAIPRDTSFIAPILFQYDANDAATLTRRFRGLHTLSGRPAPIRPAAEGGGIAPSSPYVTEDIDHGLACVRAILRLAGAATPCADAILRWRATLEPDAPPPEALPGTALVAPFDGIEALMAALG